MLCPYVYDHSRTGARHVKQISLFLFLNLLVFYINLAPAKFLKFLRPDQKFKNPAQLIRQMNTDVIFAKKGLKTRLVL